MALARSARKRLRRGSKTHFPGELLFDRIARACCDAECLARKELYEAWEAARRVRRRFSGGRLVDLAAGHGLLGQVFLLLDPSITESVAVDVRPYPSSERLDAAMRATFGFQMDRYRREISSIEDFELQPYDLVVAIHACGGLTDRVLEQAMAVRARVAVIPCCHAHDSLDTGGLSGWMPPDLAIDATRAARLRSAGYWTHTSTIPGDITPKNRLLLGAPR